MDAGLLLCRLRWNKGLLYMVRLLQDQAQRSAEIVPTQFLGSLLFSIV